VAVRYAARLNGLDALALTKLDVLDGMERLDLCTAYRCGDRVLTDFPADLQVLADCEPIYESIPGWSEPTKGVRDFASLPSAAQAYVRALEQASGVPAAIISTGSDRDDTIVREDSVLSEWLRTGALR
jgi:adenylosuccinate synthase